MLVVAGVGWRVWCEDTEGTYTPQNSPMSLDLAVQWSVYRHRLISIQLPGSIWPCGLVSSWEA